MEGDLYWVMSVETVITGVGVLVGATGKRNGLLSCRWELDELND